MIIPSTVRCDDDVTAKVRDRFGELLLLGTPPASATQVLLREWSHVTADPERARPFWLALAATQWEYGCLEDHVLEQSIRVIGKGEGLSHWEGTLSSQRHEIIEDIKEKLLSPQTLLSLFQPPVTTATNPLEFTHSMAPDERSSARSTEHAPRYCIERCWARIDLDVLVGGKLGTIGLGAVKCRYDQVRFVWNDADTLHVHLPRRAVPEKREVTVGYFYRSLRVFFYAQ